MYPTANLIVEAVSVEVVGAGDVREPGPGALPSQRSRRPRCVRRRAIWFGAAAVETPIYARDDLRFGHMVAGPAVIIEASATTVVEPGWRATVDRLENLVLERVEALPRRMAVGTDADPVMLEVFGNLYMSIAEQMGVALQSTSRSVNIKERLDYSCAVFDRDGALIANAPHMPIHLGSMGESVKVIIAARQRDRRTAVACFRATSTRSMPLTTAARIFRISQSSCLSSTAEAKPRPRARPSRSSTSPHAGTTPTSAASRPARCRRAAARITEEGVLIDNFLLVDAGRFCEPETLALLAQRPLSVAQSGAEHRRPQSTGRGLRQGRAKSCGGWCASSGCR